MARGQSADTIAKAIGGGVSARTIQRRMGELKGKVPSLAPSRVLEDADAPPVELPSDLDLATVDGYIRDVEQDIKKARAASDHSATSSLFARLVALLEHKRKATPVPKPDPNEDPDMRALAAQTIERLHKIARDIIEK